MGELKRLLLAGGERAVRASHDGGDDGGDPGRAARASRDGLDGANKGDAALLRLHVWEQEQTVRTLDERSAEVGHVVETAVHVLDVAGIGSAHLSRDFLSLVLESSKLDKAHYAARLSALHVINATGAVRFVWGSIARWLDARTQQKIVLYGGEAEWRPQLGAMLGGDAALPRSYGGAVPTPTRHNFGALRGMPRRSALIIADEPPDVPPDAPPLRTAPHAGVRADDGRRSDRRADGLDDDEEGSGEGNESEPAGSGDGRKGSGGGVWGLGLDEIVASSPSARVVLELGLGRTTAKSVDDDEYSDAIVVDPAAADGGDCGGCIR